MLRNFRHFSDQPNIESACKYSNFRPWASTTNAFYVAEMNETDTTQKHFQCKKSDKISTFGGIC